MTPEEYLSGAPIIGLPENNDDLDEICDPEILLDQEITDYESDGDALLVLYGEMIAISKKAQFVLDLDPSEQVEIISNISESERSILLARICMVMSLSNITPASNQQVGLLPTKLVN